MHSPEFKDFRIGLTRLVEAKAYRTSYHTHNPQKFVISVFFFTPHFVYEVDYTAAKDFVTFTKACAVDDLIDQLDDIPF